MTQLYRENPTNTFTPWSGEPINDITYSPDIADVWTDAELKKLKLFRPAPADQTIPEGKIVEAITVKRIDGVVKFVWTFADEPIPSEITPLQARKALRQINAFAAVAAFVETLSDEEREEWEYATRIRRDNPIIAAGATALGWTPEQVDGLFRLGAKFV